MKTYTITVDIMDNTSQDVHSLPVYNQGDINTSVLNLNITQDDVPYDLTGSSVSVVFIKSDGTVVYQDSTNGLSVTNAIGGAVSVSLNTQTLASLGRVTGAVKIQNGNSTIETGGFYFVVKKSLTSNVSIASDNSIVPLQSLIKFKSFTATNQQTLFDLSDVGSYTPGQNRLNVVVGGVPQPPTAYTENTSTTFTLSEPLSTGTVVNVEWVQNGNMYIAGHNTTHQLGGGDALDVTKLVNYTEQIATPISNINASLADIATVNNHSITYDYDTNGNVQTVTEKDSSNVVIKTVTYTYDSTTGNVTSSVTVMNGKTVTTTYNYDASGNITSTSNVIS